MRALIDSNIVIDFLSGRPEAAEELGRYEQVAISAVTHAEVMTGAIVRGTWDQTRAFLMSMQIIAVDQKIAELGARIRVEAKIKMPDALIWATARTEGIILVTRNFKDFAPKEPSIRIPYQI